MSLIISGPGAFLPASGTVTGDMIANGTIADADISSSASIATSKLAANSITVTAGTGLSGGGTVALGNTVSLTANVTSVNGQTGAVTVASGLTTGKAIAMAIVFG